MQTVSKTVPKSQLVSRRSGIIWIQIPRKRIAEWFLTLQKQLKMAWKELLYCLMTQTLLCWCYITWISFFPLGLKELWLRYGTGAKQRFIPIHTLCIKIGNIQYSVLKAHILTGCDVMSKVGTKLAAVNSIKKGNAFTTFAGEFFDSRKSAEVFLVNVLSTYFYVFQENARRLMNFGMRCTMKRKSRYPSCPHLLIWFMDISAGRSTSITYQTHC